MGHGGLGAVAGACPKSACLGARRHGAFGARRRSGRDLWLLLEKELGFAMGRRSSLWPLRPGAPLGVDLRRRPPPLLDPFLDGSARPAPRDSRVLSCVWPPAQQINLICP